MDENKEKVEVPDFGGKDVADLPSGSIALSVNEIIAKHKDEIAASVEKSVVEQMKDNLVWRLNDRIVDSTNDFFKSEIEPLILDKLMSNRVAILDALGNSLDALAVGLSKKLTEAFLAKISELSEWKIRDIVKAIFD